MSNPYGLYPQAHGTKVVGVLDNAGPTSYTQMSTGTPATGGQSINASAFGMKYFDHLVAGQDASGVYFVTVIKQPGPQKTAILVWWTASGMTQVAALTNLSTKTVTLRAIGQ